VYISGQLCPVGGRGLLSHFPQAQWWPRDKSISRTCWAAFPRPAAHGALSQLLVQPLASLSILPASTPLCWVHSQAWGWCGLSSPAPPPPSAGTLVHLTESAGKPWGLMRSTGEPQGWLGWHQSTDRVGKPCGFHLHIHRACVSLFYKKADVMVGS
jgi:hypothetical protein